MEAVHIASAGRHLGGRFTARLLVGCPGDTLVDGPITATLLFSFNEAGLIASVRAESRGAGVGKDMVMLPWDCALSDYQPQDGMLLPMTGEAAWMRPDGRKAYFVGHVKKLSYEFLP